MSAQVDLCLMFSASLIGDIAYLHVGIFFFFTPLDIFLFIHLETLAIMKMLNSVIYVYMGFSSLVKFSLSLTFSTLVMVILVLISAVIQMELPPAVNSKRGK